MLMQIAAWVIGISVAVLGLAYATIFAAMLVAKFRQTQTVFRAGSAGISVTQSARMLSRHGMDTLSN